MYFYLHFTEKEIATLNLSGVLALGSRDGKQTNLSLARPDT